MKKDIEKYELIEKYLKNELEGKELSEFRERLSSDKEFASEVKHHEEMFHVLIDHSLLDVRNKIGAIHRQHSPMIRKNRTGRNLLYFIAGGIFLISIPVLVHINSVKDKKHSKENIQTVPVTKSENKKQINPANNEAVVKKDSVREIIVKADTDTLLKNKMINNPDDSPTNAVIPESYSIEKENTENKTTHEPSDIMPGKNAVPDNGKVNVKKESYDCSKTKISAIIETEKSCDNKPTGKLSINKNLIEGGDSPYTVSIDDGKTYHKSYIFENLYSASYKVYIKDIHNCISKIGSYWIESVSCSFNDAFAPGKGEVWKIPTRGSTGRLRIYNTSGKLVYEININYEGEHEWDGRSGNGEILPMGAYSFILELDDDENISGTVTIIR